MNSKRASATLVAAVLATSACAPPAPVPSTPVVTPSTPSFVVREPELLGVSTTVMETSVHAARRDILGSASYDLPIVANSWVESELDFLIEQRRDVVARWLSRGDYYQTFVESVFRSYGIPTDLHHLGMIESGFLATAKSRVGAMGFWQFMPATARDLGLRITDDVDERMDPVRSTRAAARHLRGLYRELRDWPLAAAAYNAGGGRIGRGMRAFEATTFWELAEKGDLAAETKQYVPRLYAMTVIGRDRERFGLPRATSPSFAFDSIHVEYATPFSELASLGGVDILELTQLNPHLLRQTTPAGGYWVWVPAGTGVALQRAWLASEFRRNQGYGSYTVRSGDTLGELAEISGVRSALIREINPDVDFDRLQIGEKLRMPARAAQQLAARPVAPRRVTEVGEDDADDAPPRVTTRASGTHNVEAGETLSEIALAYDVSVAELQRLNDLTGSNIRVGQTLRVPTSSSAESRSAPTEVESAEHVVRSGESLWAIARQYRTTVAALQTANQLGEKPIQPGQKLTVPTLR